MQRAHYVIAVSLLALLPVLPARTVAAAAVPTTACRVFPADNVWNTDISTLPVNSNSATWLASLRAGSTRLHPDFGPPDYGIPFNAVGNSHPTQSFQFDYPAESDNVPYPFGPDIGIEGGRVGNTGDGHALIVNRDTCTLYELYQAYRAPQAGSGAVFDLNSNALRPAGWTSADAAGLSILAGLVRYDEVAAGAINHAIRFTAHATDCKYIWPARHQAGTCNPALPPMGARFRLRAGFDISTFSSADQVVLKAFQHYGLILADNGSDWFFQGTADPNWTPDFVDGLKSVPASAFEAIDESALMVDPDSGRAATAAPYVSPAPGTYRALPPGRILDTRTPTQVGPRSTPLGSGEAISFPVGGLLGVPAGASAALLNVTVTGPTDAGFLTLYPAGTPRPTASSLNWTAGLTIANLVSAPLGAGGQVSAFNSGGQTDLVVDLAGYFLPGDTGAAGRYHPVIPARVADSRPGPGQIGDYSTALTAGSQRRLQIAGRGGIPAVGASAVVLNVTATNTTSGGYLTVWPDGDPRPTASNLNWSVGRTVPNRVVVKLGQGGSVDAYNYSGQADLVVDVGGWYSDQTGDGSGTRYTPVAPVRVLDTRPPQIGPYATPFGQGQSRRLAVAGQRGLPSAVGAVTTNVTVVNPTASSFLTVYPDDLNAVPVVSDLNFGPGQTVAAMAVTLAGADGGLAAFNLAGTTDVIVDVLGYYT